MHGSYDIHASTSFLQAVSLAESPVAAQNRLHIETKEIKEAGTMQIMSSTRFIKSRLQAIQQEIVLNQRAVCLALVGGVWSIAHTQSLAAGDY